MRDFCQLFPHLKKGNTSTTDDCACVSPSSSLSLYLEGYCHGLPFSQERLLRGNHQQHRGDGEGEEFVDDESPPPPAPSASKNLSPRLSVLIRQPQLSLRCQSAAPLRLRAFLDAFRRVNEKFFLQLIQELDMPCLFSISTTSKFNDNNNNTGDEETNIDTSSSSSANLSLTEPSAAGDASVLHTVFSDIAIQAHIGSSAETPFGLMGFHVDSFISLLHMAISVFGERTLHYQHHRHPKGGGDQIPVKGGDEATGGKGVEEGGREVVESSLALRPGSVYVASPSWFRHRVEYNLTEGDTEALPLPPHRPTALAIQCRILVDQAAVPWDTTDWASKVAVVGKYLLLSSSSSSTSQQ